MAEIEFARRAQTDLQRLRAWLADVDPDAARRAAIAIVNAIERLGRFPGMAPPVKGSDVRELQVPFGRYGYVVRYVLQEDRVLITRVFHGRESR
jgi:plasmid stabilization system protein ParE